MTKQRKKLGSEAEGITADFLRSKGLRIIELNHRNKIGEIDIIAKDGDIFIIVEVKSKTGIGRGSPEEMVDRRKQRKLIRTAEAYFMLQEIDEPDWRIDVVAVEYDNFGDFKINWLKNAVEE
ncbi:YraN family protein [Patescibacteria group bacterium]|nr:YraN family protein [Patescibacteria group bacterium]